MRNESEMNEIVSFLKYCSMSENFELNFKRVERVKAFLCNDEFLDNNYPIIRKS